MRDYKAMRKVLAIASRCGRVLGYSDFDATCRDDAISDELVRLYREGLLAGAVSFTDDLSLCIQCEVTGLTDEGCAFFRLIENESVWAIVCKTLDAAAVDLSYPLLKEVCEEIVKRYVTGFIPIG